MLIISLSLFLLIVIVLILLPVTCPFVILFVILNLFIHAVQFNKIDTNHDNKKDSMQIIYDVNAKNVIQPINIKEKN